MISDFVGAFLIVKCQFGDAEQEMIVESSVRNLGDKAKTLSARLPLTRSDWSQMMRFCYERWCPKPHSTKVNPAIRTCVLGFELFSRPHTFTARPALRYRPFATDPSLPTSNMLLEEQRFLHEDLERLEQGISDRVADDPRHVGATEGWRGGELF